MPFQRKRNDLLLITEEKVMLQKICVSRTEPAGRVTRAKIMLDYEAGKSINSIALQVGISRPAVERCIDKAIAGGVEVALNDLKRAGRPAIIDDASKSWVIDLACQKPTVFGYAQETWTISLLSSYVRKYCQPAGYPSLMRAGKSAIHGILSKVPIKPHKTKYYLEKRDEQFAEKMVQILLVYQEIALAQENAGSENERVWTVVSYDEKPGIQAIGGIAPDLPPCIGQHATWSREFEYKRMGTVSLMAGIDLFNGEITGIVRDRHRSREFIEFLQILNQKYPKDWRIRIILDNHSAHVSKETMKWLKEYPNRYEFIFTPKHGSWLNLIEVFFSKMARSLLRGIRVGSRKELIERIYRYLDEVNAEPKVFKWKYKLEDIKA